MEIYNEKRNNRIGLSVSVGVHLLLLFVFFLYKCGGQDGPPFPVDDIGVSVDYGVQDEGSGEPTIEEEDFVSEIDLDSPQEEVESSEDVVEDVQDLVDVVEPTTNESIDPLPVTEDGTENVEQQQQQQQPKVERKPFKGGMKSSSDGNSSKPGNEGDPNAPKTLDDHTGGGADGSGFNFSGWTWTGDPDWSNIKDGYGEISFEIDEFGDVTNVRIERSSFTPSEKIEIERIIRKLVFQKVNNGEVTGREHVSGKLIRSGK